MKKLTAEEVELLFPKNLSSMANGGKKKMLKIEKIYFVK